MSVWKGSIRADGRSDMPLPDLARSLFIERWRDIEIPPGAIVCKTVVRVLAHATFGT